MIKKTVVDISQEEKDKIAHALNTKIPSLRCPMCSRSAFTLITGYLTPTLSNHYKKIQVGGSIVPTVAIVCDNCGFISQHSVGVLGLMEAETSSSPKPETN